MKENTKADNKARTQISDIGKVNLLDRLFAKSGYKNTETLNFKQEGKSYIYCSKLLLEGIDFDLTYTPLKHLGYKATLFAIGSIYAKAYQPKGICFSMGLSARFCVEDIEELWSGILAATKEHNIEQVTLELNSSITGLSIAASAIGEQDNAFVENIRSLDNTSLLCLSGNVGAAYMGLHVLEREKIAFNNANKLNYKQSDLSKYKYILSQYLSPNINPQSTKQFGEAQIYPSTGYFITKGLAYTIKQLCKENNVGAKIYLSKIPIAAQTFEMAEELNMDAITAALNGGDDYKILYIIPINEHQRFHKEFPNVDIIGHLCKPEAGENLITPEGAEIELKAQGW